MYLFIQNKEFLYVRHSRSHDLILFSQQPGEVGAYFPDEILNLLMFKRDYVDQLPKGKVLDLNEGLSFFLCLIQGLAM